MDQNMDRNGVNCATRYQLILPVHSHNVTKNLTGDKMQDVEGPQIYQIRPIAFRIYVSPLIIVSKLTFSGCCAR